MIKLFTEEDYKNTKSRAFLPFRCERCEKTFFVTKHGLQKCFRYSKEPYRFCSNKCLTEDRRSLFHIETFCTNCNKPITKRKLLDKRCKSKNRFCNSSCAGYYNNTHKTHGTRISKLEKWLKIELGKMYPELEILYNGKTTIKSELDIYIPSLKLAFEVNGIFHYEPIYGEKRLNDIQINDKNKQNLCQSLGIKLIIIDSHKQREFTEVSSVVYLDIIKNEIESLLGTNKGDCNPIS